MVVDITGVPNTLANLMKASEVGYNTVSPMVLRKEYVDEYFGTNCGIVGPVVLGLALLGAEQPAYITQKGFIGLSMDGTEGLTMLSNVPAEPEAIVAGAALGESLHVDGPMGNKEESQMPDDVQGNETGTGFKPAEPDGQFSLKNIEAGPDKGMGIGHLQQFMDNMTAMMTNIQAGQTALNSRIDGIVHESFSGQMSGRAARWTFMDDATRTAETERIMELHKTAPAEALATMDAYDRMVNMAVSNGAAKPPNGQNGNHPSLGNQILFERQSAGISQNGREVGTGGNSQDMNNAILEFAVSKGLDPVLEYDRAVDQWCAASTENAQMFEWMQGRNDVVVTGEYTITPH